MGMISKARALIRHYRTFDPERDYLEKSATLMDLERRQREIDDGRFRRSRTWPY